MKTENLKMQEKFNTRREHCRTKYDDFVKNSKYGFEDVNEKVMGKLNKAEENLGYQKMNDYRSIEMRKERERLRMQDVNKILER